KCCSHWPNLASQKGLAIRGPTHVYYSHLSSLPQIAFFPSPRSSARISPPVPPLCATPPPASSRPGAPLCRCVLLPRRRRPPPLSFAASAAPLRHPSVVVFCYQGRPSAVVFSLLLPKPPLTAADRTC
ncbi:Os01g0212000, partial [Oryza sativa Japonica Group]